MPKGAHTTLSHKVVARVLIAVFVVAMGGISGPTLWRDANAFIRRDELHILRVNIPATPFAPEQTADFISGGDEPAPLIVDLHNWSSDLGRASGGDGTQLDELAERNGWSYIRSNLTGANDRCAACCSSQVIMAIDAAISYARHHAKVTSVHVIGGSGGGYTALCAALSGRLNGVDDYQAWAPITDLAAWYRQRPGPGYERDILGCTGSVGDLNVIEAHRRSPMFMPIPRNHPPIHLFVGVHDGTGGSSPGPVQISHALRMYNRLANTPVPDEVLLHLIEARRGPQTESGLTIQGRRVHLAVRESATSLVVFEGGHELLGPAAMAIAKRDALKSR